MGLNQESRTINASKNAISAVSNKIIILLLTFFSRKFFIEYIGVEYLGINGLFSNVLTLLSMADLGIGTAMNVSLYKPIAEGNTRKITALLNYFKRIYIFIAVGVTVIGVGLIPFLKYLVNMDKDIPYLYVYYMVFVIKNAVSYLFVYKSSLIKADQKTYLINRREVIINLVKVVLQFVCVIAFRNYLIYILLEVAATVGLNFVISHEANKRYSFIKNNDQLDKEERKGIFSDVFSVFLYKIAWSLLNGTDNILMSVITGTITVGLYSNYTTITRNIEMFITLLFTSLTAGIGNLVATSSAENKHRTFKTMQMVSFWICGIVCVCLFFLMQDFIQLWIGKEFLFDNLTMIAIVLNVFFSICMRPVWTFREGTGMYKQIRYIMFVTAILNLVLSIAMGYWLGVSGILFATSISKLLTYFWYEPKILFKNFFNVSPIKYYLEYLKNGILLLVTGVICYIPIHFISSVSIFSWIIKAVICMVVVNVCYFLRYFKTDEFTVIKGKVLYLLKRKGKSQG